VALIDTACAGQVRTTRANIDVVLPKTKSARLKVPSGRADLSHRHVRCDVAIHLTFEHRAISRVARRRSKRRSTRSTMVWVTAISTARSAQVLTATMMMPAWLAVGVVRIIGKEWVQVRPRNPCCLRIGERDFLWRLAPMAAIARTAIVSPRSSSPQAVSRAARYSRTAGDASSTFGHANGRSPGIRFFLSTFALITHTVIAIPIQ
jgi:hypothetical protein